MGFKSKLSPKDVKKAEKELNEDPKLCVLQKNCFPVLPGLRYTNKV